ISIIGGGLSSIVVLGLTLAVAAGAVRFGGGMGHLAAPPVPPAGDMGTLPSLFPPTPPVGIPLGTPLLGVTTPGLALGARVGGFRAGLPILRRIVRESLPVLVIAGTIDVVAGLSIEKRLESFLAFPALLVLIPPFLEDTGAVGSIVASRLASKLHLGVIEPT